MRWVHWLAGFLLIGNFFVLRAYGDTLRSTNLFVARSTVFYPIAYLNLAAGVVVVAALVWQLVRGRK